MSALTDLPPASKGEPVPPFVIEPLNGCVSLQLGCVPGGRVGQLAFTLLPALLVVGLVLVVGLRALRMGK